MLLCGPQAWLGGEKPQFGGSGFGPYGQLFLCVWMPLATAGQPLSGLRFSGAYASLPVAPGQHVQGALVSVGSTPAEATHHRRNVFLMLSDC